VGPPATTENCSLTCDYCRIHTHTHPFNGHLSRTTQVSRYQKGKTNLDFTEARDSEWQRYQLGHMQVCTSLQTDNHASTLPLSFFTGRMPFLQPNQQRQISKQNIKYAYFCYGRTSCIFRCLSSFSSDQCGIVGAKLQATNRVPRPVDRGTATRYGG